MVSGLVTSVGSRNRNGVKPALFEEEVNKNTQSPHYKKEINFSINKANELASLS